MATEDIRIEDGRILVDRFGTKTNVDVAASDVDSVTFVRSGGDGQADGALVLHTENGDVVIRVANDDAGEALALVRDAGAGTSGEETGTPAPAGDSTVDNSNAPKDITGTKTSAASKRAAK